MKKISVASLGVLFSTVFLTGAGVLILEVTAVRLLTPIFGGSMYVLSSVLSIVLLALSLGYFVGGRIADKHPHPTPLYFIISGGALSILVLQYGAQAALNPDIAIGSPILGPLIYSSILFFLPAFLLGMDSPYVIRIISEYTSHEEAGKYVGTTFFWSTIGSICGSIGSGFWLIPTLGVHQTITYTAFTLAVLSITAPFYLQKNFPFDKEQRTATYFFSTITLLIALAIGYLNLHAIPNSKHTIHSYDGFYTNIRVEEHRTGTTTVRQLRRDTNHSSAVFLGSLDHVYGYTQFADLYKLIKPDTKRVLVVGGGAYTIPRRLVGLNDDIIVDVVEIEPSLFELAQTYFDLSDVSRINNHVADARVFLQQTDETYDFIFTDAMSSAHNIPFQLATQEFFALLQNHLNPDGVLIANSIAAVEANDEDVSSAFYKTMSSVFPYVEMYQVRTVALSEIQNIMYIAQNKPITDEINTVVIDSKNNSTSTMAELAIDTAPLATSDAPILTDNDAPIEYLLAKQMKRHLENAR